MNHLKYILFIFLFTLSAYSSYSQLTLGEIKRSIKIPPSIDSTSKFTDTVSLNTFISNIDEYSNSQDKICIGIKNGKSHDPVLKIPIEHDDSLGTIITIYYDDFAIGTILKDTGSFYYVKYYPTDKGKNIITSITEIDFQGLLKQSVRFHIGCIYSFSTFSYDSEKVIETLKINTIVFATKPHDYHRVDALFVDMAISLQGPTFHREMKSSSNWISQLLFIEGMGRITIID